MCNALTYNDSLTYFITYFITYKYLTDATSMGWARDTRWGYVSTGELIMRVSCADHAAVVQTVG